MKLRIGSVIVGFLLFAFYRRSNCEQRLNLFFSAAVGKFQRRGRRHQREEAYGHGWRHLLSISRPARRRAALAGNPKRAS